MRITQRVLGKQHTTDLHAIRHNPRLEWANVLHQSKYQPIRFQLENLKTNLFAIERKFSHF